MSKLDELFVSNINKAIGAADVMSDINAKPMAYASIAHALAVYLQKERTVVEKVEEETLISDDLAELKAKNEEVANAINDVIEEKEEEKKEEWTLPYDENGIPYLNDEDFSDPQKVLAYQNAMTPEMEAKKQEIINAQGQAILNEDTPVAPAPSNETPVESPAPTPVAPAPVAPQVQEPAVVEFKQEHLDLLESYKNIFDYTNAPGQLDKLYHNFTDGVSSTLNDITPTTIEAFLYFIQEELAKAKESLEAWKNSWITKEGLDNLVANLYQVQDATIDTYINDGNIFWFLENVELYNANAWFNSYMQEIPGDQLDMYAKQYFDNNSATVNDVNETNVVGYIYFIQQSMSQTA